MSIRERARIERVLKGWTGEWDRSSYRLIRFPVLESVGVGRIPSKSVVYIQECRSIHCVFVGLRFVLFCFAEIELPKVARKKMDPLLNAEDDIALLDELLKVGEATQKLSVCPKTLAVEETDHIFHMEMPKESYIIEPADEEVPGAEATLKRTGTSTSGVTATGKRVADDVAPEGPRGKRPRNVNVPGKKDGAVTFQGLAPEVPEVPRGKLKLVLEEAGMADEGFVRQMVADLKDANVDQLLASGATPRENRDKMRQYLMRVSLQLFLTLLFICCFANPL